MSIQKDEHLFTDRSDLQTLYDMIADLNEKLDKHIEDSAVYRESIAAKLAVEQDMLKAFQAAFPDDDPKAHRLYHETLMEKLKEEAELRKMLKSEVAKWGLIAFLAFVFLASWKEFLSNIHK